MQGKNKAGKAVLKVPEKSLALTPRKINAIDGDLLAAVTNIGRMLVFSVKDLPELAKGKGNKIINIPTAKAKAREEFVVDMLVFGAKDSVVIKSGKRELTLKPKDIQHYQGERARRGNKLPRGFQRVDSLRIV